MTHALTTAAARRAEIARIEEAGEARAAQLTNTPRKPDDPAIRPTRENDDE